jgi:hypothetical protein
MGEQFIIITLRGVKGVTGTAVLGPRTLLTGAVGVGKSAYLFGLQLVLFGRVPSIGIAEGGKQDVGRLRLYMRDGGSVTVGFPDGRSFGYALEYTEKSARLKARGQAEPDGPVVEGAEAEALIADWRQSAIMCSWSAFQRANDRQRRDMILDYFPGLDSEDAARWARCEAYAALADLVNECSVGTPRHTADAERTYRLGAVRAVGSDAHGIIEALEGKALGSLAARLDRLHTESKRTENERKARKKAVEGLSLIEDQRTVTQQAGELPVLEERLRNMDTEIAALDAQAQAHERGARNRTAAEGRLTRAKQAAERLRVEVGRLGSVEACTAAAKQAADAEAAVKAARPALELDTSPLVTALADAEAQLARVMEAGRQQKIIYLEGKAGTCPLTKGPCSGDLSAAVATAKDQLAVLAQAKRTHEAAVASINAELAALAAKAKLHKTDMERWRDAMQAAIDATAAARQRLTRAPQAAAELADAEAAAKAAQQAFDALTVSAAADPAHRTALEEQRGRLTTQIKVVRDAKARLDVVAGAGVDAAEYEAKLWKAAWQGAVAGRNAYLQSRTAKTASAMQRAVKALGLGEEFVIDLGADMRLGVMRDGVYVDVEALSGGQSVMFGAALLAALPVPKEGERRIIIVEGVEAGPELPVLLDYLRTVPAAYIALASATAPEAAEGWLRVRVPEDTDDSQEAAA